MKFFFLITLFFFLSDYLNVLIIFINVLLAMPDIQSRSWIIRLAKIFRQQLSANDIATHAGRIGISNPNKLLNCIQNRGTHTAREIVRLICSQETLLTKSGKEAVSEEKREAIRGELLIEKLFNM